VEKIIMLTSKEIVLILEKIHPGFGYSKDPGVSVLQAKLSIMLEVAQRREARDSEE